MNQDILFLFAAERFDQTVMFGPLQTVGTNPMAAVKIGNLDGF